MNDDTLDNDDVVMVAGGIPENHVFEEDEAVAVCANWSQVRQFLHKKKLNRGYVKQVVDYQHGFPEERQESEGQRKRR